MLLLLTIALAGLQAHGLVCPEPNKTSSVSDHHMVWICGLRDWRNRLAGLKNRIEQECFIDDVEIQERWQLSFQCLDFSNISCMNNSLRDDLTDLFNCTIIFCDNGQYSDENALLRIWRQHFSFYESIMAVSRLIRCRRSECPDPTIYPEETTSKQGVFEVIQASTEAAATSTPILNVYSSHSTVAEVSTIESLQPTTASGTKDVSAASTQPSSTVSSEMNTAQNCGDVDPKSFKSGNERYGVFEILIAGEKVDVSCDLITDGGNWTVIQRRMDGSVNFYRGYNDYVKGFGDISAEFWLGLDNVHNILRTADQFEIRFDLEDWDGVRKFAKYSRFSIGSSEQEYQLSVGEYSGTAGDSFSVQNGAKFSTADHDVDFMSDQNCAVRYNGAWWYTTCHHTNLNGLYHIVGEHETFADGINWYGWHGFHYSLRFTEMKIRPMSGK